MELKSLNLLGLLVCVVALTSLDIVEAKRRLVTVGGEACAWSEGCTDFIHWYKTTPLEKGDYAVFKYSNMHNVYAFKDYDHWLACNITGAVPLSPAGVSPSGLPTAWSAGTGKGVRVKVTHKPKYVACTVPADFPPEAALGPLLCLSGVKVILQAGLGKKERAVIPWVLGGYGYLADYQIYIDSLKLKLGESVRLQWHGNMAHNVHLFKDLEHFKACNFTGSVELADIGEGLPGLSLFATGNPQYVGCTVGPACQAGMKFMLPPGL